MCIDFLNFIIFAGLELFLCQIKNSSLLSEHTHSSTFCSIKTKFWEYFLNENKFREYFISILLDKVLQINHHYFRLWFGTDMHYIHIQSNVTQIYWNMYALLARENVLI